MKNRDEQSNERIMQIKKVAGSNAQSKLNTIKKYRDKKQPNRNEIISMKKKNLRYTLDVMDLEEIVKKVHNTRNNTPIQK
mmetsp:Transcript_24494/g.21742  ORF Transcript_24494/g.21742 Transcript_24494/m.21742 type:complete len:80 (-) Transcript_24494:76-315(-)